MQIQIRTGSTHYGTDATEYNDQHNWMKSAIKQSLKQYVHKQLNQNMFEKQKYLFDFVQILIESINAWIENNDEWN